MKKGEKGAPTPTETNCINDVIGGNAYISFGERLIETARMNIDSIVQVNPKNVKMRMKEYKVMESGEDLILTALYTTLDNIVGDDEYESVIEGIDEFKKWVMIYGSGVV